MENQHRHIKGYRDLSEDDVTMINAVKESGDEWRQMIELLESGPDYDQRALALARTNLQQGLMWLIRAIARPDGFC